ncbi:MAG: hypothetical protein WBZ29_07210 [Methanocella sp.]
MVALIVLIALGIMTPALAWKASKIGVSVGDFFFGDEALLQKPSATLFHSQTEAATDTEAFALNFPATGADLITDGGITELGPSIAQTSAETLTAADTGFYKANWCYTAFSNLGGYDLVPDFAAWHPMNSPEMAGSGVSWPYMNNAPLYGESAMQFQPAIVTSPDTSQANIAPAAGLSGSGSLIQPSTLKNAFSGVTGNNSTGGKATNVTMLGTNQSANNTAAQGKNATAKAPVTTPNRDYKNMTKPQIKNSSVLERIYKNANAVNPIPKTYKGTVDRPTMIAPVSNPMADILAPANKTKVIRDANNITKSGTHLTTKFWDL